MILRARVVLPVTRPPIEDGAVRIAGNRIVAVGRWRELGAEAGGAALDLGERVLLPGLVNAHCHLDYTSMAGQIGATRRFVDWIKLITTAKSGMLYADFAEAWLRGARMLVRSGTTTVADIESVPELLPEVWESTPLRVISFLELTGVKSRRQPRLILQEAVERVERLPSGRCAAGLSPHAPYSTVPELLRLSAQTARERGWRVVMHVAESQEEFEMFAHGRGEMYEWLKRNERDMGDCGHGSPAQHLDRHGMLGANLLAVHANYLAPGDADLLGRRSVSVAHCPRSHVFFGHRRFPREELTAAGVNICLGTDSLATVRPERSRPPELDLFAEMRTLAAADPGLSHDAIVRMATVSGARALGLEGAIGELSPGAFADLIALPCTERTEVAADVVVRHAGPVAAVMIDGQWALKPAGGG